jgi:hypothetical protein
LLVLLAWLDQAQGLAIEAFSFVVFAIACEEVRKISEQFWSIWQDLKPLPYIASVFVESGSSWANENLTSVVSSWTALIAILLLKILQFKSAFGWALSNLVALLRWNLFSYRDLWEWINHPFDTPPESPGIQGELFDLDSILRSQT